MGLWAKAPKTPPHQLREGEVYCYKKNPFQAGARVRVEKTDVRGLNGLMGFVSIVFWDDKRNQWGSKPYTVRPDQLSPKEELEKKDDGNFSLPPTKQEDGPIAKQIAELRYKAEQLRSMNDKVRAENDRLSVIVAELRQKVDLLTTENEHMAKELASRDVIPPDRELERMRERLTELALDDDLLLGVLNESQ